MPLQSTRFIKRCWCGQPASVCKKAAAEAQDKGVCPKCGARPHVGDYVHCPHDHAKIAIEFDLETAIARLYYNYSGAMQEIIDTVLLLKDDRELCTIAE